MVGLGINLNTSLLWVKELTLKEQTPNGRMIYPKEKE